MSADGVLPVSDDTRAARCVSAKKLVDQLHRDAEFADLLRASVYAFSGSHVQARQTAEVAAFLRMDKTTVWRWVTGESQPKARDVWPVIFVAMLSQMDEADQHKVVQAIEGLLHG